LKGAGSPLCQPLTAEHIERPQHQPIDQTEDGGCGRRSQYGPRTVRDVAIKISAERFSERFEREALGPRSTQLSFSSMSRVNCAWSNSSVAALEQLPCLSTTIRSESGWRLMCSPMMLFRLCSPMVRGKSIGSSRGTPSRFGLSDPTLLMAEQRSDHTRIPKWLFPSSEARF
jgi:hypothetical protein